MRNEKLVKSYIELSQLIVPMAVKDTAIATELTDLYINCTARILAIFALVVQSSDHPDQKKLSDEFREFVLRSIRDEADMLIARGSKMRPKRDIVEKAANE